MAFSSVPNPSPDALADLLRALDAPDGVIAFATDTVYGLGARLDRPQAIARIYALKGRDERKPLTLLGASADAFAPFIDAPPPAASRLMQAHWPGALTLVLDKTARVPDAATRGGGTIACRVPDCDSLRQLLRRVPQGALATTSANASGQPPCLTGRAIRAWLGPDFPVWGRDEEIARAQASTVARVDVDGRVEVLRAGPVVI